MSSPEVTIGVSIYKQRLDWVQSSIQSALTQSLLDIEVIARVDGSGGCDSEVLEWLLQVENNDPRFRLILGEKRLGTFGSYASIFKEALGDYICQLDADDILPHHAIKECMNILKDRRDVDMIYTDCTLISPEGEETGQDSRSQAELTSLSLLTQFITFHLRVIKRSTYAQVGGYNPQLKYTGDYDLSLKLQEVGIIEHMPQALYKYRVHESNTFKRQTASLLKESWSVALAAFHRRKLYPALKLTHSSNYADISIIENNPLGHYPKKAQASSSVTTIIVAGMHRSGTSLCARILSTLGVDIHNDAIVADTDNPYGYYEDSQFLALNRGIFRDQLGKLTGFSDWGISHDLSPIAFNPKESHFHNAKSILSNLLRGSSASVIGWKDPRNTLLLEFWSECAFNSHIIAVYRAPWEVFDALQRIAHPLFRENPENIIPIWRTYNRKIIELAAKDHDCITIISSQAIKMHPHILRKVLNTKTTWLDDNRQPDLFEYVDQQRMRRHELHDELAFVYQNFLQDDYHILEQLRGKAYIDYDHYHSCQSSHNHFSSLLKGHLSRIVPPRLTVVITTKNRPYFLAEAIASFLKVSFGQPGIELIIVDDSSTDEIAIAMISALESFGVCVVKNNITSGLAAARNSGFAKAESEIVLPFDDDNHLLHPYLQAGLEWMETYPELDVVYGNRIEFGDRNSFIRVGNIETRDLIGSNKIDACALIRKSFWERCGGYDTTLMALEDWDLWLTGSKNGMKIAWLDKICYRYRTSPSSMSSFLSQNAGVNKELLAKLQRKHGSHIGHEYSF